MLYGSPRNINGGSPGPDPLLNAKRGKGSGQVRGCAVQDPRIPGENAVLIWTPNYHKRRIKTVCLLLCSHSSLFTGSV